MQYFVKSLALNLFIFGTFLIAPVFVEAAGAVKVNAMISNTVLPFFEALKSGDVQGIESCIGGKLELSTKTLLRKNQEYPQFLRNHYAGAVVRVGNTAVTADEAWVDVEIDFPGKETRLFKIRVRKNNRGIWKIVEQTESY